MKKDRSVAAAVVNVFLAAAVVLCLLVTVQVLNRGYASVAGHSLFRVVTGSMEPTIPVGGLVVSKETQINEISIGDIICFRAKDQVIYGEIVTHRVVAKIYDSNGELFLKTRGDANPVADGYLVSDENLVGEIVWYTGTENVLSKVVTMLTSKYGFFACILLPILVIALLIIKDSVKNIRKELYQMQRELNKQEQAHKETPAEEMWSPEEYEALKERLRREILEELSENAETEETGDVH